MLKGKYIPVGAVLAAFLLGPLLSGCGTPQYQKYVKPYTDKVRAGVKKIQDLSDKYRDPECLPADSDECKWQREAFESRE